jgi:hypothetical protein
MWLQGRDKLKNWALTGGGPMPTDIAPAGAWLIGFLEGVSAACISNPPLAAGLDTEGVLQRVDQTCRSRPGDTLLLFAASELIKQLDSRHANVFCPASRR